MKVINATLHKPVYIGHEDDNEAICVIFDVAHLVETLGEGGDFYLRYKRPTDADTYPVTPNYYSVSGGELTWMVADAYLVGGIGELQIRYVKDESSVMSDVYITVCRDSLGASSEIPAPILSYMEYLEGLLSQVISSQEAAALSAQSASQSADRAEEAAASYKVRIEGSKLIIG